MLIRTFTWIGNNTIALSKITIKFTQMSCWLNWIYGFIITILSWHDEMIWTFLPFSLTDNKYHRNTKDSWRCSHYYTQLDLNMLARLHLSEPHIDRDNVPCQDICSAHLDHHHKYSPTGCTLADSSIQEVQSNDWIQSTLKCSEITPWRIFWGWWRNNTSAILTECWCGTQE